MDEIVAYDDLGGVLKEVLELDRRRREEVDNAEDESRGRRRALLELIRRLWRKIDLM